MNIAIIGGSGGLGKQVVSRFKDEGYNLLTPSSKEVDVSQKYSTDRFFNSNQIDVVINMSGKNFDKFVHKIGNEDVFDVHNCITTNITGCINIASSCLPGMRDRGYGRIIYASSVLATKVVLGTGLYSSCKAFIDRFVKSVSAENIGKGITCNSIQLGYMDGGLTYKLPDPHSVMDTLPTKRWGTIEEICNTIKFIISTPYVSGANIQLTGGL